MEVVTIGREAMFVIIRISSLEIRAPVIGATYTDMLALDGPNFPNNTGVAVIILLLQVVNQLSNIFTG